MTVYSRYEWGNTYNTDFLVAAPKLPSEVIDTTILHPPSLLILEDGKRRNYLDYMQWCRNWSYHINRLTKPKGTAWIIGNNDTLVSIGQLLLERGWYTVNIIRLMRPDIKRVGALRHWDNRQATFCLFMAKAPGYYFDDKYVASCFGFQACNSWIVYGFTPNEIKYDKHPDQLTEMLVDYMVRSTVPPDGSVIDPFCGSGTTAVVAERAIRKWIAFEKDNGWFRVANKRLLDVRYNMMGGGS